MAGDTTITIIGNLTADPELRQISSGAQVASFTIASTPRTYNRNTGQWDDGQALFMRCSAWRDLAAHIAQSLHKGMRVIAQGRLQQRSYQAQDGSNRTVIEMTVDEIGPSLRYATATVERQSSGFAGNNGGYARNNGGFGGNNSGNGGFVSQGGYQGGAGYSGGYNGGASMAAAQPAPAVQQQPTDPWSTSGQSSSSDFGNFGSTDDFGGSNGDEPEF